MTTTSLPRIPSLVACALLLLSFAARANDNAITEDPAGEETIEELIVWGRAESQKGSAMSASQGLVGYADFATRPLQRVGELVEVVPGMVATQHSAEGKANQYFLRGMNLDHGTDFSSYFEGMPVNLRAHAHGQGYLDLNFLIPEIVSTVAFAKGPYAADRGDFSTAGTTNMEIYDRVERAYVELTGGSYDYWRGVVVASRDTRDGHLLGAAELLRSDGPWELPANVEKLNLITKYTKHFDRGVLRLTANHYDNRWNATDQVPERLVTSGALDRFGFVDPDLRGASTRTNLIGSIDSDHYKLGVYASRYRLRLLSNFSYLLNDPVNGDQFEQVDRRWIYGGYAQATYELHDRATLRVGADVRYDDVSSADLYATRQGVRIQSVRTDQIEWLSLGAFAELKLRLGERLRAVVGLREDYSDYTVRAQVAANGGSGSDSNLIPSVSFAYSLNDHIELYANWGMGFHTNDVRGVTIEIDPRSREAADPVDLFANQEGAEIGFRAEGWHRLAATVTLFWLQSDSELLFLGDSGATEPGAGSERFGLEATAFWTLGDRLSADINLTLVDSEFKGVPTAQRHIPNAQGRVISGGVTFSDPGGWTASIRARHFGDAPLTENNSIRRGSTMLVNTGVSYDFGRVEVGLDLINLLDARDNDIAYFFESQLPGETSPVADVHFHPVDPLSARVNIRYEL